jgi:DNA-binding XRE family transcriptional regulator
MTQRQLAEVAGIDQATVSNLEAGKTSPSWETAFQICQVLKVKPEDIFPVERRAS